MSKRELILHIIARDLATEDHIREVIHGARERDPTFLEGYTLFFSYKGEVDMKLLESKPKQYKYKVFKKTRHLGWSHEIDKLNILGKQGWKIMGVDNNTLILMRELNE